MSTTMNVHCLGIPFKNFCTDTCTLTTYHRNSIITLAYTTFEVKLHLRDYLQNIFVKCCYIEFSCMFVSNKSFMYIIRRIIDNCFFLEISLLSSAIIVLCLRDFRLNFLYYLPSHNSHKFILNVMSEKQHFEDILQDVSLLFHHAWKV